MSEFTVIESQEQLNEVIKDRLARERAKYADYEDLKNKAASLEKENADLTTRISGFEEKETAFNAKIAERDATIKAYELKSLKAQIAHENGLNADAVEFLQGTDEESLRTSAASLKNLLGAKAPAPNFTPDEGVKTDKAAASVRRLASALTNNN